MDLCIEKVRAESNMRSSNTHDFLHFGSLMDSGRNSSDFIDMIYNHSI